MTALPDQQARLQALNTSASYIVQAPAGSGKTELLSLRYLNLLSGCKEPEEVLAITFTRKAASEMKERIIEALQHADCAESELDLTTPLQRQRYQIARAALDQSRRNDWGLLQNPGRLKIQTIDGFCYYLASRIPLLARVGGAPNLADDVDPCLNEAVVNTLQDLNSETAGEDINLLLEYLDNDMGRAEKLLYQLLGNRDQWLSHVLAINSANRFDREYLQSSLEELIEESLAPVHRALLTYQSDLVELTNHTAHHLPENHALAIKHYQPLTQLPACNAQALPYWRLIVNLLLTKQDTWRKQITKADGIPVSIASDPQQTAVCKARKAQWSELIQLLSGREELREELAYLRLLPDPALEDRQWHFLTALGRILIRLSSHLILSFRKFRRVDHAQVASAALSALGSDQQPTDLALALDHRLQHILVDEFQDTSKTQTDLLLGLTAGWQPDDGRTLFLVGDAMQSVYAFRNANVGIYLSVREEGLGHVPLTPLTLQSNFRSQAAIVEWVNRVFISAFPNRPNPSRGAVAYTESIARLPVQEDHGVTMEFIGHERSQRELARDCEASRIAQRVLRIKASAPGDSVAILVRARSQLNHLIPALKAAGIHWQATDIDRLTSLPVIDDLQSLTRAIVNLGDRIAWLAVLRAPWCGLSLDDLHTLTQQAEQDSIWAVLETDTALGNLTEDGRARLESIVRVLRYSLSRRGLCSLRRLVEAAWTLLGGASLIKDVTDQASVAHYFDLLEQHESGGSLRDIDSFSSKIASTFVPSIARTEADGAVHILTMHKAKGLEFDHVILPGLDSAPQSDSKSLLQWHERVNARGVPRLFMAALSPAGSTEDPLYGLLQYEKKCKAGYEKVRLLYIGVTRARRSAHLSATLVTQSDGDPSPSSGSLLDCIWSQLAPSEARQAVISLDSLLEDNAKSMESNQVSATALPDVTPIRRFSEPLSLSADCLDILSHKTANSEPDAEPLDTLTELAQLQSELEVQPQATVGTLIHQALETLVAHPDRLRQASARHNMKHYWELQLTGLVDDADQLQDALGLIEASVNNCIEDPQFSWIFNSALTESGTEVPISGRLDGRLQNFVVDRTFVDDHGTRWIIDYKSALPPAAVSEQVFVDQQCEQHRPQLQAYRRVFAAIDPRPIRTALLFTAIPRLVEINEPT